MHEKCLGSQCLSGSGASVSVTHWVLQSEVLLWVVQEARKLKDMLIQGAGVRGAPANVELYACRLRVPLRNLTCVCKAACWSVKIISIGSSHNTVTVGKNPGCIPNCILLWQTLNDCAGPEWCTAKQWSVCTQSKMNKWKQIDKSARQHYNLKSPHIDVPPLAKNSVRWLAIMRRSRGCLIWAIFFKYQCYAVCLVQLRWTVV